MLGVALILTARAAAYDQPIECLEGGCTLVPNRLLEQNDIQVEKMRKEIIRLRATTGCA